MIPLLKTAIHMVTIPFLKCTTLFIDESINVEIYFFRKLYGTDINITGINHLQHVICEDVL